MPVSGTMSRWRAIFRIAWFELRSVVRTIFGLTRRGQKPTRDDADEARLVADRLLHNIGTGERQYLSRKLDIYLADVETTVDGFDFQLQLVQRYDSRFPCMVSPESRPVPVTLEKLTGLFWILRETQLEHEFGNLYFNLQRSWMEAMSQVYGRSGFRIELLRPADAIDVFHNGLVQFLTSRFSARRSDISESPGLFFRVYTRNLGLRVYYAPSYFIDWRVLGSPTSPVGGWIQPGLYQFAAEGSEFRFTVDAGNYEVPPRTEAHLLNA
jgi:hypothetical protein